MSILAAWYYTSPEGQQFLEARNFRMAMAAVGILAAYILLRTRRRQHPVSWWWTVGRWVVAATLAAALWLGVDWVRSENWVVELGADLPKLYENGIRYVALIVVGWLGWTVALSEGWRRIAVAPQEPPDTPAATPGSEPRSGG